MDDYSVVGSPYHRKRWMYIESSTRSIFSFMLRLNRHILSLRTLILQA